MKWGGLVELEPNEEWKGDNKGNRRSACVVIQERKENKRRVASVEKDKRDSGAAQFIATRLAVGGV